MPIVWFAINVAEFSLLAAVVGTLVPDAWPTVVSVALVIAGIVVVGLGNYRVLRSLRRREDVADPRAD